MRPFFFKYSETSFLISAGQRIGCHEALSIDISDEETPFFCARTFSWQPDFFSDFFFGLTREQFRLVSGTNPSETVEGCT